MKSILFSIAVISLSCSSIFAESSFNDGFAKKKLSEYFDNLNVLMQDVKLVKVPGITGKQALRLTYDNESYAEFKSVAVLANQSYSLNFRGKWINDETVETNPTFEYAWLLGRTRFNNYFPSYELSFSDANGKQIKRRGTILKNFMLSNEWTDYRCVFFPPDGAAFMDLKIRSGMNNGVLYLDNMQFKKTSGNKAGSVTINFHKLDNVHGSIYGLNIDKYRRILPNGDTAFATPSFVIPFSKGTYVVDLKCSSLPKGRGNIKINFLNAKGKIIGNQAFSNKWENSLKLVVPDKTAKIRFQVWSYLIEEIKISRKNMPIQRTK